MWASLPIASSPEHCLPNYPVLVHRLASLLRPSFRPRLAAGVILPFRFAITSRPSRCEEDLHLQAVDHARHTTKNARPALQDGREANRNTPRQLAASTGSSFFGFSFFSLLFYSYPT